MLVTTNDKNASTLYTESITGVSLELRLFNGDGLYLKQSASIVVGCLYIREWVDGTIEFEIASLRTAPFIMPLDLEESFSIELTIALPKRSRGFRNRRLLSTPIMVPSNWSGVIGPNNNVPDGNPTRATRRGYFSRPMTQSILNFIYRVCHPLRRYDPR